MPHMMSACGQSAWLLLHEASDSLRTLGKRSALALLGIAIGSSSVVAMINIANNAAEEASMIFKGLGVNTFVAYLPETTSTPAPSYVTFDTGQLRKAIPGIQTLAPIAQTGTSVIVKGRALNAELVGTTAELLDTLDLTLHEGRFLSAFDQQAPYVVVGHSLAQALAANGTPLRKGDRVRIGNYLFQVIGILHDKPYSLLTPVRANDSLFLTLNGLRRVSPSTPIGSVIFRVAPDHDIDAAAAASVASLQQGSGATTVEIVLPQQLMEGMSRQNRTFTYLLTALGAISLIGGGTGVMNVMLMNVTQRRREIGVRMALGARRADIRHLFMLEAFTLTAVGAFGGGALGVAFAALYAHVSGWTFFLAPAALPLGVISTLGVGMFFGLYPAVLASRLQPVEALRDE